MGKDLRTLAAYMKLQRYPKLDMTAWELRDQQPFFPPLERLFKTETLSSLNDYGIRISDPVESVVDADHIRVKGSTIEVHRKTTMILSPYKWMRGDYTTLGLPKPQNIGNDIQKQLQSPHTAAYVGALTSIALSESGCIHFPKVYGVYAGMATRHMMDISDDYEDLQERRWFGDNIGKTFDLKLRTETPQPHVTLGEETDLLDVEDVDADHVSNPSKTSCTASIEADDENSQQSDDAFEIHSCACSEGSDEEAVEDEDEEPFAWAVFRNVPVMTTIMEKCEGTFYDLVRDNPSPEKQAAWVAQIVFALAYAQRNFGFVHNDLHGNNVMYVSTKQEYVYYKHGGVCYRVPTYGYILKIIDFDRAILSLRLQGMKDPRQFASSQFEANEEAAGQYNMEPFFDSTHPHIPPSPSFDLARFATSVYWDMFPEGPKHEYTHPLHGVFLQWMKQSDGSSVMFRQQMDNHDRYHGFDLYKAITRYCKDAVPRREISKLTMFQVESVPLGSGCLMIEN
jgi:hypothetical protein